MDGEVGIGTWSFTGPAVAVARSGVVARLTAGVNSRVVVIGEDEVNERHITRNFNPGSRNCIEKAKADWKAGRPVSLPGDRGFDSLPVSPEYLRPVSVLFENLRVRP